MRENANMSDEKEPRPLVIYHADCLDGFCAAFMVWRCLYRDGADYLPMQYGSPAPDVAGRDVLVLDFSFPRAALLEMKRAAKSMRVFDHHKTAAEDCKGFDWCEFDMAKCGARIVWDWLRRTGANHMKLTNEPGFLAYIEDRDLWAKKIPHADLVTTALRCRPWTFQAWSDLANTFDVSRLLTEGTAIQSFKDRLIAAAVSSALEVDVAGHKVMGANVSSIDIISEVGHALAQGRPFAAVYFTANGKTIWNLRSTKEGLDVSVIAKRFGGGGHRNAAGFVLDANPRALPAEPHNESVEQPRAQTTHQGKKPKQ